MMLKRAILLLILSGYFTAELRAQNAEIINKPQYLSVQSGLIVDRYNSLGIRLYFEYQKKIKGNWQYGFSYENSRHFSSFACDHPNELATNLDLLSLNGYYRINLFKDKLFWNAGLGIGGGHVYWEDKNKIGFTINASMTLNIKITKRVYFECSPLIVLLPTNRIYYSPLNAEDFKNFYTLSVFPFGLKVKL